MCRNIKPLFNFEPPVTTVEVQAAALQYVRKVSGFQKPSKTNQDAFQAAVDAVALATSQLLASLETTSTPKNRAEWVQKAKTRSIRRFGQV